jgi:hypothetical protein
MAYTGYRGENCNPQLSGSHLRATPRFLEKLVKQLGECPLEDHGENPKFLGPPEEPWSPASGPEIVWMLSPALLTISQLVTIRVSLGKYACPASLPMGSVGAFRCAFRVSRIVTSGVSSLVYTRYVWGLQRLGSLYNVWVPCPG